MKKTKIINLFAGPGASKSTTAAILFGKMKQMGINCELVSEYAKHATWRKDTVALSDQLYITAKQNFKLHILNGQVDYIISDSPLILGINYVRPNFLPKTYNNMVIELFNSYDNINFFINRKKKYNPIGRSQTEDEAKAIDREIFLFLINSGFAFNEVDGDNGAADEILRRMGLQN